MFNHQSTGIRTDLLQAEQVPLDQIKTFAESQFKNARGSHDWDHTLRVCGLCRRIGRAEKVNMEVLIAAAYLHDIGRCYQDDSNGRICHAEKGAGMAETMLKALQLTSDNRKNIVHCIKAHRFRGNNKPETPEAQVLFDADKLDSIGAVGVARAFLFAGEVGACLHNPDIDIENTKPYSKDDTGFREYRVKLLSIRERILTDEGRNIADERHAFMKAFFKRFIQEYQGEK